VRDFGEQQRIARFSHAISSVRKWLDDNFTDVELTDEVKELVRTLRAYLAHCRRGLGTGQTKASTIERRCRKIEDAAFTLWKVFQDEQ
jgi:hypothetical protein